MCLRWQCAEHQRQQSQLAYQGVLHCSLLLIGILSAYVDDLLFTDSLQNKKARQMPGSLGTAESDRPA